MPDDWREIGKAEGERLIKVGKWRVVGGGPDHADYACGDREVRKQVRPDVRYFFRPLPTIVGDGTIPAADGMRQPPPER